VTAFEGLAASKLSALLDLYSTRLNDTLAEDLRATLDADQLRFSWEGSITAGFPHYYRLAGNSYLLEHENAAHQANHVHNVMRRCAAGVDAGSLLRQHRAADRLAGDVP
jgi:hypothetical protein